MSKCHLQRDIPHSNGPIIVGFRIPFPSHQNMQHKGRRENHNHNAESRRKPNRKTGRGSRAEGRTSTLIEWSSAAGDARHSIINMKIKKQHFSRYMVQIQHFLHQQAACYAGLGDCALCSYAFLPFSLPAYSKRESSGRKSYKRRFLARTYAVSHLIKSWLGLLIPLSELFYHQMPYRF